MPTYKGSVNWAGRNDVQCTAMGTFNIVSLDHEATGDEYECKDGGEVVGWIGFNERSEITFEGIPFSSGSNNGTLTITKPTYGQSVTFTVTNAKDNYLTGSYICKGATVKTSPGEPKTLTIRGTYYPNVPA